MSETIRITVSQRDKLFSLLKKDKVTGKWKHKTEAARATGLSRPTIDKFLKMYPEGNPQKPKLTTPLFVEKYENTTCHKKIMQQYGDKSTGKLDGHGQRIDKVGLELFLMFNQTDPTTLEVDQFRIAKDDPRFIDRKTGAIDYNFLSPMRIIMVMAGIDPKRYPEFTTKGTKRPPQKKGWFLSESELLQFIYGINEVDTLVMCRIGFESGGRFSSTSEVTTDKIAYEMNMIEMYEPKVSQSEERYFIDCTMHFVRQYIKDFNVIGKLFRQPYKVYLDRLEQAGQRAKLFRYTGQYENVVARIHGKPVTFKRPIHEGKKTSTHLIKHTFVSLSSLHGFGLDDVSEQTGTDPDTLRKYYLGVGKKKLKGIILGKIDYVPWGQWVEKDLHPHWQKRYEQLKAASA